MEIGDGRRSTAHQTVGRVFFWLTVSLMLYMAEASGQSGNSSGSDSVSDYVYMSGGCMALLSNTGEQDDDNTTDKELSKSVVTSFSRFDRYTESWETVGSVVTPIGAVGTMTWNGTTMFLSGEFSFYRAEPAFAVVSLDSTTSVIRPLAGVGGVFATNQCSIFTRSTNSSWS
eukprot:TRINITY_DN2656_c0_g1_i1.p1 TRINITY_DN2656_c0_g1~~TRINITY_DN2656_c0_g1_i1.p1  ORF type:complete len:172 (-),score=22.05 TRINITY_DN2656_c0_g1_i1:146-661(-)